MMISSKRSTKSWAPTKLVFGLLAVAPIGFADATYLTVEHYVNAIPPCSLISNCEKVLTSPYSTVFGVPLALLGALYYLAVIIGLVAYFDSKNDRLLTAVAACTTIGLLVSVWLVLLQLVVIKAICIFCMLSAASSTALFVLGMALLWQRRKTPAVATDGQGDGSYPQLPA